MEPEFPETERLARIVALAAAIVVVLIAQCTVWAGKARAADWKPDRHIVIVVPTAPGSGVDSTARTNRVLHRSLFPAHSAASHRLNLQ